MGRRFDMKFKDNLRKVRNSSEFSQEKLAEEMSVSRQTISKWENGDSFPSTEHIFQLTKILHCSYDELINGEKSQDTIKNKFFIPKRFLLTGLIMVFGIVFGVGLSHLISTNQTTTIENAKLATFDTLAENFLANTNLLPNEDATTKVVGYGITDEDGTFYIKCDVYSSTLPGNHCAAIIYFCENNDNYSYKCQILDDPNYHPSGEYYQVI
ncbi:helix-turn-helix domain-containing protein [Candidatus Saccharibacteria bacterium]|nr:helix-turn-helix domain-containing protein [Candidatus Saccharibacteria bacterium]